MINETWKTVIFSEENMRDSMMYLMDDYIKLVRFYEEHKDGIDDATWVHVDVAKEEREELESEVTRLENALDKRNEEYLELYDMYKAVLKANEDLRRGDKPKKKLLKTRKPTININEFKGQDDDDLPF